MKKILLILSVFALFSCSSDESKSENNSSNPGQTDSNLSKYEVICDGYVKFDKTDQSFLNFLISKGYDLNNDSKISCDEASKIEELDLGNKGYVKDLIGIESFSNLKILKGFVQLQGKYPTRGKDTLNLYNNTKLEQILFNSFTSTGQGVMEGTIPTVILPKNSNLKTIDFSRTTISEFINLESQGNLKTLNVPSSKLETIDLSGSSVLEYINLNQNLIKSIKFSPKNNPYIKKIDLGGSLNSNANMINEIELGTFSNLEELNLSFNNLKSIDLSKNTKLTSLDISRNKLIKLDLSSNQNITILKLDYNSIGVLETSNLSSLSLISATNNLFGDLDFSSNKSLYTIYVDKNDLKALNLQNGRSKFITNMSATQNIQLGCIKVDSGFDPNSKTGWKKDTNTKYCN